MALGGGTFLVQNKVLPGTYVNFISTNHAAVSLSDRGIATMPLELDWGVDGEVFEVTNEDFQKNSLKMFGYDYAHEKLKGLRDLFLNTKTLYAYRLNSGEKASNTFATAKCSGTRGNALKVVIQANVDTPAKFDINLFLDGKKIDSQTVSTAAELLDNDFVIWKKDASLAANAGLALSGGTNATVDADAHQSYLDKIEAYSFNTMGVVTTETAIKQLYSNFTKRMREEIGAKFQLVVQGYSADYEGVINVKNVVTDAGDSIASVVYWVTGLLAGCPVNKSCLNRKYDGEFKIDCGYTQAQLAQAINDGEFTLHNVGKEVKVLKDINSLVTATTEKGDIFKNNQTIRVIDGLANDTAAIFNQYCLGVMPNDESGRIALWTLLVKNREELQKIRAIENFKDSDITVTQGDTKQSVVLNEKVTIVNAMEQLYVSIVVA